jgi:hypothetical protein
LVIVFFTFVSGLFHLFQGHVNIAKMPPPVSLVGKFLRTQLTLERFEFLVNALNVTSEVAAVVELLVTFL